MSLMGAVLGLTLAAGVLVLCSVWLRPARRVRA